MKLARIPHHRSLPLLCVALTLGGTLNAQETLRQLTAEELSRASLGTGEALVVTGKYKELIDDELYLYDCHIHFRIVASSLYDKILNFTPKKDNLTVVGTTSRLNGELIVRVRELRRAPADFALFSREFEQLAQSDSAQRVDRLIDLGRRVLRAKARQEDPRLLTLARQSYRTALEVDDGDTGEKRIETMLSRIKKVHDQLQDDAFTRDLILVLLKETPEQEDALKFLRALKCRVYGGRWVTYTEYKTLEGLLEHEGRWVTPRELHHLKALELFARQPKANLILLRRRTEKEYVLVAEAGNVETGMKREEFCLARGFPDYVLRRAHKRKEFDQWSYGTKYYYFYDGILVFLPRQK